MGYADKLSAIAEKKKKLLAEETKLMELRRKEVAALAERFGLLQLPDEVLSEIFQQATKKSIAKPEPVSSWESEGGNPSPDPTVT
jgi:hypothetical protein